jgi:hypothetical protein
MSLLLGKHGLCPAGLRPKQSFECPVCGIGDRQQLAEPSRLPMTSFKYVGKFSHE